MDWNTVAKQQEELLAAVEALRKIFDQVESAIKMKQQKIISMITANQGEEAKNLAQIHQALDNLLKSSNLT
jgi:vacuolar-type H+-ATPase subunit E/Vma4